MKSPRPRPPHPCPFRRQPPPRPARPPALQLGNLFPNPVIGRCRKVGKGKFPATCPGRAAPFPPVSHPPQDSSAARLSLVQREKSPARRSRASGAHGACACCVASTGARRVGAAIAELSAGLAPATARPAAPRRRSTPVRPLRRAVVRRRRRQHAPWLPEGATAYCFLFQEPNRSSPSSQLPSPPLVIPIHDAFGYPSRLSAWFGTRAIASTQLARRLMYDRLNFLIVVHTVMYTAHASLLAIIAHPMHAGSGSVHNQPVSHQINFHDTFASSL